MRLLLFGLVWFSLWWLLGRLHRRSLLLHPATPSRWREYWVPLVQHGWLLLHEPIHFIQRVLFRLRCLVRSAFDWPEGE